MMQQRTQQRTSQRQQQKTVKRYCHFCVHALNDIDYKEVNTLRRFTSSYGKIVPPRRSGVCAKHQRKLANAIKRARIMALLPFVVR